MLGSSGKKIFGVAAVFAVLAGPAHAQTPNINLIPEFASKTPEEKEQESLRDKAYRESLKKIPDSKGTADPWGNVRSVDTSKAAAKPVQAKSRIKTGSTVN